MTSTHKVTAIHNIPKTEFQRIHIEIEVTRIVDDIFIGKREYTSSYTIEVWQYGATLFAWNLRDEFGVMYSGDNGGFGQKWQGLGNTLRDAKDIFKRYIINREKVR